MSYTYLIDLYDLTNQRLNSVACLLNKAESSEIETDSLKGRSECLREFKEFLTRYDNNLPRRLRGKYLD